MTSPGDDASEASPVAPLDDAIAHPGVSDSLDTEVAWLRQAQRVRDAALVALKRRTTEAPSSAPQRADSQTLEAPAVTTDDSAALADYLAESERLFALTRRLVQGNGAMHDSTAPSASGSTAYAWSSRLDSITCDDHQVFFVS